MGRLDLPDKRRDEDLSNTPEAWDQRARRGESSWDAAMWSCRGQSRRFHIATKHLDVRAHDSVLDYGCGTGRLAAFLPSSCGYIGFDWSEEMVRRAARENPGTFQTHLPGWRVDHVVAIGTFNLADNWSKRKTWDALEHLWRQYARKTLLVSVLRSSVEGCLSYRVSELAEFAQGRTNNYLIDAGYLPNDLMLVMRREHF